VGATLSAIRREAKSIKLLLTSRKIYRCIIDFPYVYMQRDLFDFAHAKGHSPSVNGLPPQIGRSIEQSKGIRACSASAKNFLNSKSSA
jgi:hypothetical protein